MIPPDAHPSIPRVAVVDDDEAVRTALVRLIRTARCDVDGFDSAEAFLASPARYGCVVLDVNLPGLCGLDLEAQLRAAGDSPAVVFISGGGEARVREIARCTGRPSLGKPVDGRALLVAVALALQPQH